MLNKYFEKVVCLNQPERLDRWLQFCSEADRIGLKVERFYSLPGDSSFDSFCKSQLAMINDVKDYNSVLTLEDDVVFQPLGHIQEALDEVPVGWDMIYLGANVHEWEPYSKHLRRVKKAWTTHAVVYSKPMMRFIVENYKSWEENGMYDDWLSREVHPKFKCFVVSPMMAYQRPGYSDLWNNRVSYGWKEMNERIL